MSTNRSVLRVFLVEDSSILADLVTRLLDVEEGIEVIGRADTAEAATAAIRKGVPDVVVLDLHLRHGTGYDVLRETGAGGGQTVFIVLSNHTADEYRRAALESGAHHFFDKSREIPALLALVRRIASERRR